MLELDHVLCLVRPDGDWPERLTEAGWVLDAGSAHPGQGTRNRRVLLAAHYLELVWVEEAAEARANPLRLDRRADGGASPFGFGLRGRPAEHEQAAFWRYDDLGFPIWVHRSNEQHPERPLVFVLDLPARVRDTDGRPSLRAVQHRGPAPADLPVYSGPPVDFSPGPHRLELATDAGRLVVDAAGPELSRR